MFALVCSSSANVPRTFETFLNNAKMKPTVTIGHDRARAFRKLTNGGHWKWNEMKQTHYVSTMCGQIGLQTRCKNLFSMLKVNTNVCHSLVSEREGTDERQQMKCEERFTLYKGEAKRNASGRCNYLAKTMAHYIKINETTYLVNFN